MVGEPKKKTATKSLSIFRKARGETSELGMISNFATGTLGSQWQSLINSPELFHGFTGNAKDPQKFSSAQSVALNLWSKRHCSAEKRNEKFILSKNNAIVNEIEGSTTVEYKTIRETLAKQRGRLEEFNLLCNNVEASLKAFWSRRERQPRELYRSSIIFPLANAQSTSYVATPLSPELCYKPTLRPRKSPDCYNDDMAVRRLRK